MRAIFSADILPILLLIIPVFATVCGGLLALRFRRYMFLLIAVGAGLLLGAAFLDLLPEAIALAGGGVMPASNVLALTLLAFLSFLGIENAMDHLVQRGNSAKSSRKTVGRMAGAMLIFHSFRDGMAIGAAYAASHPAGYVVAVGIAAHDLGDGMNTVILSTGGEEPEWADYLFLLLDALAPLAGGLLTVWWVISSLNAVILLTLAAGFFIQMATSDFLPEVRRSEGPRRYLMPSVLMGTGVIYVANLLLSHH
jgi:zinc and cadmium transporter